MINLSPILSREERLRPNKHSVGANFLSNSWEKIWTEIGWWSARTETIELVQPERSIWKSRWIQAKRIGQIRSYWRKTSWLGWRHIRISQQELGTKVTLSDVAVIISVVLMLLIEIQFCFALLCNGVCSRWTCLLKSEIFWTEFCIDRRFKTESGNFISSFFTSSFLFVIQSCLSNLFIWLLTCIDKSFLKIITFKKSIQHILRQICSSVANNKL